jgi:hypothetical protein
MTTAMRIRMLGLGCLLALALAACDDDDGSGGSNPTPTASPTATRTDTPDPTATATATPTRTATPTMVTQGAVAGLLVVRRDVGGGAGDALASLPSGTDGFGHGFDRVLSHADWAIDGTDLRGETDANGRFSIGDLAPGRYHMQVTKTADGNLVFLGFPVVVGDLGAEVVAEIALGLVKSTSTYLDGEDEVSETNAPNGTRLVLRNGRLTEFGDYSRTWTDPDGDGRFEPVDCSQTVYSCADDRLCRDDLICGCTASCQGCDDCGPLVCTSPGTPTPYSCNEDDDCKGGGRCVCVPSCEDCLDCLFSVCVPSCEPATIESVEVRGLSDPAQLIQGQTGNAYAVAHLSDGSEVDVTWTADWASSDESVATIDGWGTIETVGIGSTDITATFAGVESAPKRLTVVERPALLNLYVQNADCFYYFLPPGTEPPIVIRPDDAFLPPPSCGQVVRIGATLHFTALGEFEGGYYEDVTDEVEWLSEPEEVGTIDGGVFTSVAVGTARISASLGTVQSDVLEVRVVDQPTIISLSIYPSNYAYGVLRGGPIDSAADAPCFECGYQLTLLRGDQVQFNATAHYDTGEWEDVTERVAWRSSDTAVASIDAGGLMTASSAGDVAIDASLDDVTSAPVNVHVVNEATLLYLSIYQDGYSRVTGKGDQVIFRAVAGYDVGFERDVTDEVTWRSSDESIGRFLLEEPGVFVGVGAGNVEVYAELGEEPNRVSSQTLPIEVFETSEIEYCDPNNVNRGTWSDDFNRVVLESDCAEYTPPSTVTLRFTVTEQEYPGGIFDPCLDLFAYRDGELVRTIREEGCGEPFLAPGAPEADDAIAKYQVLAFWNLRDEAGELVPAGTYTIYGRFYLYFDPVVSVDVTVNEAP